MQQQSTIENKMTFSGLLRQDGVLIDSEDIFYTLGRFVSDLYPQAMLRKDIHWHAPPPEGPKILAPNHPTTTDPIYLLSLLSEPVSFLITAASFNIPVIGHYLRAAGHIPAIRNSGGATVDALASKVESGRSVAIFPEGALSPLAGGFHPPHSGVARVALRTGAPVIPIGIGLQRDRIHVKRAKIESGEAVGHFYLNGPYAITVGQPMYFTGELKDRMEVHETAGHIMHHFRNLACESEGRIHSGQAGQLGALTSPKVQWSPVRISR